MNDRARHEPGRRAARTWATGLVAVVVVACLVASGCQEDDAGPWEPSTADERAIAGAVQALNGELAIRDGSEACALMTPGFQDRRAAAGDVATCDASVSSDPSMTAEDVDRFTHSRVYDVAVDGDRATALTDSGVYVSDGREVERVARRPHLHRDIPFQIYNEIELVKVDGDWHVDDAHMLL